MKHSTAAVHYSNAFALGCSAIRAIHAMIWPKVPRAIINIKSIFNKNKIGVITTETFCGSQISSTWMIVKENIQQALIAPRYIVLVLLIEREHFFDELELAHSSQIHEHDTRVEAELAVVGMSSESIVPAHVGVLVLGRQRRQVSPIEVLEVVPDLVQVC
jgi:hypothetical protein